MGAGGGGGYGPQISANQAKKEYQALPDYAKRATGAPYGMQQYGSPERYHLAGVTPGWYNSSLNPRRQMKELEAVEAAKRLARANRLNPPIIPPTRGAPTSVPSGAFNINQATPSILQQTVPTQGAVNSTIEDIRNAFIQSLLAGGGVGP
jgi:hypothetical protein